ncbi:MAG: hypothetical protein AAB214_21485, partial [Fibrobacterota bacterium]
MIFAAKFRKLCTMKSFANISQFYFFLVLIGALALIHGVPRPSVSETFKASPNTNVFRVSESYAAGYGSFFSSIVWVGAMFDYADVLFDDGSSERLPSIIQ